MHSHLIFYILLTSIFILVFFWFICFFLKHTQSHRHNDYSCQGPQGFEFVFVLVAIFYVDASVDTRPYFVLNSIWIFAPTHLHTPIQWFRILIFFHVAFQLHFVGFNLYVDTSIRFEWMIFEFLIQLGLPFLRLRLRMHSQTMMILKLWIWRWLLLSWFFYASIRTKLDFNMILKFFKLFALRWFNFLWIPHSNASSRLKRIIKHCIIIFIRNFKFVFLDCFFDVLFSILKNYTHLNLIVKWPHPRFQSQVLKAMLLRYLV